MKIYVTRYGQSTLNESNKVSGISDVSLTTQGIYQAELLSQKLKSKKIDIIISSPLKRAIETSNIISKECSIDVIIDDRLAEQNYGDFEGVDRTNPDFLENKMNFAQKYPNGESTLQVVHRVYNFLEEIKTLSNYERILIVSHGGICRVINTYFSDMTNSEFFNYRLNNCELKEYLL